MEVKKLNSKGNVFLYGSVTIIKRTNIKNMIPECVLTYEYATRTRTRYVTVEWSVVFNI